MRRERCAQRDARRERAGSAAAARQRMLRVDRRSAAMTACSRVRSPAARGCEKRDPDAAAAPQRAAQQRGAIAILLMFVLPQHAGMAHAQHRPIHASAARCD